MTIINIQNMCVGMYIDFFIFLLIINLKKMLIASLTLKVVLCDLSHRAGSFGVLESNI